MAKRLFDSADEVREALGARMTADTPVYNSPYADGLGGVQKNIEQMSGRDFTYNPEGDPTYQYYKKQYTQGGQRAMRDTTARAAALTGGYGNSYGQVSGQQSYNDYMSRLAELIPTLEEKAYNRQRDKLNDQYNLMSMYQNLDNTAYGRYQDALSREDSKTNQLAQLYGIYNDKELDERNFAYQKGLDERNFAYQKERDAVGDYWTEKNFNENQRQFNTTAAVNAAKAASSGSGNTTKLSAKASKFATGILSESDFEKESKTYGAWGKLGDYTSYESYVAGEIAKAVKNGDITVNDMYDLMERYGIEV